MARVVVGPAHGQKRKHKGAKLSFDEGLGVWKVAVKKHVYFHEDAFLRFKKGVWMGSKKPGGPWKKTKTVTIPPGLHAKYEDR